MPPDRRTADRFLNRIGRAQGDELAITTGALRIRSESVSRLVWARVA